MLPGNRQVRAKTLPPNSRRELEARTLEVQVVGGWLLAQVDHGALRLQGLADNPEGQAWRVSLAGQHPGEPPGARLRRLALRGGELALDQPPGRLDFRVRAQLVDGFPDLVIFDAALAKLGGQRPPGQPAPVVARLDPRPGERGVVDQPCASQPARAAPGPLPGDPALAEGVREPRPGPGREREQ